MKKNHPSLLRFKHFLANQPEQLVEDFKQVLAGNVPSLDAGEVAHRLRSETTNKPAWFVTRIALACYGVPIPDAIKAFHALTSEQQFWLTARFNAEISLARAEEDAAQSTSST